MRVARARGLSRFSRRAAFVATVVSAAVSTVPLPAAAYIQIKGAASVARETIDIVFEKNGSITTEHVIVVRPAPDGAVTFSAIESGRKSVDAFETGVVRDGVAAPLTPAREEFRAAVAGFETVSDRRWRIVRCPQVEPTALVTCRRVERHESSLTLGVIPFDRDVPIDSIAVTARVRSGAAIRWLLANSDGIAGSERGEAAGEASVAWAAAARAVLADEPHSPIGARSALHLVATGPMTKRGTSFASWESIGRWWLDLIAEAVEADRGSGGGAMASGALTDPVLESDRVYAEMQSRFRYIAIELGMGGWVPDRPRDVIKRGYGDCKELAAAMVSMLAAKGVPARLALVRSGLRAPLDEAFPWPGWFNHVIVAVRDARGELRFYDPTDSAARPGRLPWSDFGSAVLVVGGDTGAELVELPAAARESTDVRVEIDCWLESGEATRVVARARATGYEVGRARALAMSAAAASAGDGLALLRAAWIDGAFLERSEVAADLPPFVGADSIVVAAEYTQRRGARVLSGGRLSIDAASLPSGGHLDGLEAAAARTQPIRLAHPIAIRQRVRIHAAPGTLIEDGAQAASITRPAYRFSQVASADSSGLLTVTRELTLDETWYDTEQAGLLVQDWREIVKVTSTPVVVRLPSR